MKARFTQWVQHLPLRNLLNSLATFAWVLDILNAYYFVRYWDVKQMPERLWQLSLSIRGMSWHSLDQDFQAELIGLANMALSTLLMTVLIVNTFFYIYLSRQKRWARQYVVSYAWGAAALCLLTLFEGFPVGGVTELINLLSIPAYTFLALALTIRKSDTNQLGFRWKPSEG